MDAVVGAVGTDCAVKRGEVVLGGNLRLDVSRRDSRRVEALWPRFPAGSDRSWGLLSVREAGLPRTDTIYQSSRRPATSPWSPRPAWRTCLRHTHHVDTLLTALAGLVRVQTDLGAARRLFLVPASAAFSQAPLARSSARTLPASDAFCSGRGTQHVLHGLCQSVGAWCRTSRRR